ncbi:uncharacterized protein CEXT_444681 [Caerostris extrusa]|uniref:Uncharacterized protein n=1 Tax=Caerostris extrusa TaxID=172846 RepID=A0AAV4NT59_CAEEX|nr:uncharacterized protein CEXT_444681 [Caerostris extrusa]
MMDHVEGYEQLLEEQDKITYRKPYSYYEATTRRHPRSITSRDSLRDSSSEESIEYEVINSYEMGSWGLVPVKTEIESKKKRESKNPSRV